MKNVGTAFQKKGKACMKVMYIEECGMFKTKLRDIGWEAGGRFKMEGTYIYIYTHLWLIHADVW